MATQSKTQRSTCAAKQGISLILALLLAISAVSAREYQQVSKLRMKHLIIIPSSDALKMDSEDGKKLLEDPDVMVPVQLVEHSKTGWVYELQDGRMIEFPVKLKNIPDGRNWFEKMAQHRAVVRMHTFCVTTGPIMQFAGGLAQFLVAL